MRKGSSAAAQVAARINSALDKPVVMMATDPRFQIERVEIGSLTMERITGGGFVRGRHVELYGDESVGKSLIAYMTMVCAQERGELCAVVDSEHIFNEAWFRHLGGDPDELLMAWPETGEELIQTLMLMVQKVDEYKDVSIVTIDSVASILPREDLRHDLSDEKDDRMASLARLMSKGLRRVTTVNTDTLLIWTNQTREVPGSFYASRTTPGGKALGFYATTRVEMVQGKKVKESRKVAREGALTNKDITSGRWIHLRCTKEKSTKPYQEAMFYFDAEAGRIDLAAEIIHLGLEDGFIDQVKKGNAIAYSYGDFTGTLKDWRKMVEEDSDTRIELMTFIQGNTEILAGEDGD